MTKEQFKKLEVGSAAYIYNNNRITATEILEIDRYYKKVKVLLMGDKFYSYRSVRVTTRNETDFPNQICGTCH
tara:strand:+ start:23016 stop:23234 length:219 start_codon:yes stop_codon:yes gene_type:complete